MNFHLRLITMLFVSRMATLLSYARSDLVRNDEKMSKMRQRIRV